MERKSVSKIVYLVISILILVVLGYIFFTDIVGADSLVGKSGETKTVDFGDDIGKKEVSIIFSGSDGGKIGLKKSVFLSCSHKLAGFEKKAVIGPLVTIGPGEYALEIAAAVGVHSENRQYFVLDKNLCPQPLAFVKNGAVDYNVYSDQPSFKLQDFNGDGWLDIAIEFRDYDKNPLQDGIRDIYLYQNEKNHFEFSHNEMYQQQLLDN